MDEESAHIEVELSFAPPAPDKYDFHIPSDYQDGAKFDFGGQIVSCSVYVAGRELVSAGEQVTAFVNFLMPEYVAPRLRVGWEFVLREGHLILATGKVTRLLTLEQAATRNTRPRRTLENE